MISPNKQLVSANKSLPKTKNKSAVSTQQSAVSCEHSARTQFNFTYLQQRAIDLITSCSQRVVTIAGYAGTGKTTMVYEAICRLKQSAPEMKVSFACYTGKAAQVLSDKLYGANVCTTHRLLYNTMKRETYESEEYKKDHPYIPGTMISGDFVHIPKSRIDAQIVVIDEVSMLPTRILNQLFAHDEVKHFILLGDPAQLPPVGQDERKQLTLLKNADVLLTEVMRQGEGSYLLKVAMYVRAENRMILNAPNGQREVYTMEGRKLKNIINRYVINIKNNPYDTENITFLVHSNRVRYNLNYYIHHLLYPEEKYHKFNDRAPEFWPNIRDNERIICTENDYANMSNLDNHIINGTVGIMSGKEQLVDDVTIAGELIRSHVIQEDTPRAEVEALIERERVYNYSLTHYRTVVADNGKDSIMMPETWDSLVRPNITLAYALTVHKAQGSEYQHVVLLEEHSLYWQCQSTDEMEEYYRWVYTAITRARKSVTIIKGKAAPHLYALWRDMDPEYIKKQEMEARRMERERKRIEKEKEKKNKKRTKKEKTINSNDCLL